MRKEKETLCSQLDKVLTDTILLHNKVRRVKQIGPLMKNYMILMMNLMMGVSQKTMLSKYK